MDDAGLHRRRRHSGLVDALNSLLCAGQLSRRAKTIIVNYVANPRFPYTTPTATQMRDRVRAVVSSDRHFPRIHHPEIIL